MIADETKRPAFARAAHAASTKAAPHASAEMLSAAEARDETEAWNDMCQSCGACCSYSADWPRFSLEAEAHLDSIPRELVDDAEHGMRCIGDRCAALTGVVGRSTSCAIYALRPDVCRACSPGDAECLQARRHFGLSSLAAAAPAPSEVCVPDGVQP
jgi:hypothetical protein